ncbi:MAG: hypothetical protein ACYTFG_03290 [Planctomycetota bacterium]|jgi:hypothetical protein
MDVEYRRPTTYIPPYNYCDRWCEKCRIDKEMCLVYQSGTDDELDAISRGVETRTMDYSMNRCSETLKDTIAMIEETAREEGIDLSGVEEEVKPLSRREDPPLLKEATRFSRELFALLEENEAVLEAKESEGELSLERFHWYHPMVGMKIARLLSEEEMEEADGDPELREFTGALLILSAQLAHRALRETEAGLLQIIKHVPALTDPVIGLLAQGKGFCELIADRWLGRENGLLEPVGDGPWWGPLRDSREALDHMRDVRAQRKAREEGG